jgi:tape measure domain-containing protein
MGFEQVVLYDRMSLSIQALIARDAMAADASLDFGAAMAKAAPQAKDLLNWTQQLAVVSIFESEDIRGVQAFAQASGIAADQAQIMTASVGAWGTVTGRTEQTLSNVTNALSDMFTKGKVQAEEMRQLARNNIPAWEYLSKALGVSVEKLREMVTKGLVPANVGIKAITDGLSRDYGPALKEFAFSAAGIASSLSDLKKIALREFFTGTFSAIQPYLERFVAVLMQPETIETIRGWGNALGAVAAKFFGFAEAVIASGDPLGYIAMAINNVIPGFYALYDAISTMITTFAGLAREAFGWGEGIGTSFAEGIIAAATYIVQAITYIGNILASWLAPGSPPRVAPDLPVWGQAAGEEWIGGFAKADMSSLKDLASSIKDVLKNAVAAGSMTDEGIIPAMLGGYDVLAQAISEMNTLGDVTAETMSLVYDWATSTSPEVYELVESFFEWEKASQAVKQAQEELDEVNQRMADSLKPFNKALKENEAAQKRLREEDKLRKLREKIAAGKASPQEIKLALLEEEEIKIRANIDGIEAQNEAELEAAQARLDAATLVEEKAKAELENKQAQIELQASHNALIAEQVKLLETIAKQNEAAAKKAAGGGGGGGGLPEGAGTGKLDLDTGILGDIQDALDSFKKKADEARMAWNKIRKEFEDSKASIKGVTKDLAPLSDLAGGIGLAFGSLAAGGIITFVINLVKSISPIGLLITAATLLYKAWTTNFMGIQEVVGGVVTYIEGLIADYIPTQTEMGNTMDKVSKAIETAWKGTILPAVTTVSEFFKTEVGPVIGELATAIMPLLVSAGGLLASIFNNVVVPAARLLWTAFTELIWPIIKVVAAEVTTNFIPALIAIVDFISEHVLPIFNDVFTFVSESLIPIVTEIARIVREVFRIAWELLLAYWNNYLFPALTKLYNDYIQPLIAKLTGPGSIGEGLGKVQEAWDYVVGVVDDFIESLGGLQGIIDNVLGWLKDLRETLESIKIPTGLEEHSPSPLEQAITHVTDAVILLNTVAANMGNIWADLLDADQMIGLSDEMKEFREEQLKLFEELPDKIQDVTKDLVDFLRETKENLLSATIGSFDTLIENLHRLRDAQETLDNERKESAETLAEIVAEANEKEKEAQEELAEAKAKGDADSIIAAMKQLDLVRQANGVTLAAAYAQRDADFDRINALQNIQRMEEYELERARQQFLEKAATGDIDNAQRLFDLRSRQIHDLAQIDAAIAGETDEGRIASLQRERDFLVQQQAYEMQLFDSQAQHRVDTIEEALAKIAEAFQNIEFPIIGDVTNDIMLAFMNLTQLMSQLASIQLPDWLIPGSPTPLEIGLRGITGAVRQLTTQVLPPLRMELGRLSAPMNPGQIMAGAYSSANSFTDARQYNATFPTNNSPAVAYQSFEIMRSMQGAR